MYGVRVNFDFVVRKYDGYGIVFKDLVRVRVRKKLVLKPGYGIRKGYGSILKWRVRAVFFFTREKTNVTREKIEICAREKNKCP